MPLTAQEIIPSGIAKETSLQAIIAALGNKATVALQQAVLDQLISGISNVNASNVTTKFREAFETYDTTNIWDETKASGDIITLDGNTMGSSYLVISKSPFNAAQESIIETKASFGFPLEYSIGLHMSQRTSGQEVSIELVDAVDTLDSVVDLAISSISQTATTLTINTATPHNLVVGKAIGVKGVSDSRLNYAQVVVASTPSPTQFTATAGSMGTIPSLTIGAINNSGSVYFRPRMSRKSNGMSCIFENTTATNASLYIRGAGGDAYPSGTVAGNHAASIGSTASIQPVNAAFQYSFQPTTEFRAVAQADKVQFNDITVDSTGQPIARFTRTQVVPDPIKTYKLRIKARNTDAMTRPVAKIVSIVKATASTSALVTTDVPHGLSLTSYVNIYGVRDQTNFANLTTPTAPTNINSTTSFTIPIGRATISTSYGGSVYLANGSRPASEVGAQTQVLQSLSCTGGVVTAVLNANWATLVGDYINLFGIRDTAGASIQGDIYEGAYKVNSISTTTAILTPIDGRTLPTQTSINCGGTVIRRTDTRISFVRIFDFERLRIEAVQRASGDQASAIPVVQQGSVFASLNGTTNIVGFTPAPLPTAIADVASAAITTTTTTAAITPTWGMSYEVVIPVTAVSGTNTPTMDVSIEESDDSGTNWFPVFQFPRITATGIYRSPRLNMTGNRLRYIQTIAGTTPSFTRAINRNQYSDTGYYLRQLIDRTIVPNTLSSATPSLNVQNCTNAQLIVNMGAITTTAPVFKLQGSDDNGVTWYDLPNSSLTSVASNTVQVTIANINCQLIKATVATAGSGATLGHVTLKGFTNG